MVAELKEMSGRLCKEGGLSFDDCFELSRRSRVYHDKDVRDAVDMFGGVWVGDDTSLEKFITGENDCKAALNVILS